MLIMLPGPIQLHERVIKAMCRQIIGHRSAEFGEILKFCGEAMKEVFGTKNEVYFIAGSGTAGVEAGIASFSKVGKFVTLENGKFGERLGEIAERYTEVERLSFDWGKPIDLEKLKQALENGAKAVAFVHNETSTGMLNPAEEIAKIARKYDALTIMDAITSAGGDYVKMDEWGIDVAVVGTQKCLGAPPGLAAVAVSERAWQFYNPKCPLYLDLKAYKKKLPELQTPYTPAVTLFFALEEALKMIKEEGMENRIKRHKKLAKAVRAWALNAGLKLFPEPDKFSDYSNTVTAINVPSGTTEKELRDALRKEYGIVISGGQDKVKGKIFRIATMGSIGKFEVMAVLTGLEDILLRKNLIKPALEFARKELQS
ncbi:MAG: alanine--glyoxylate aminotransferase family protein [Archaeoglobaceae archaeon]|nr:alanine--glyoxylate aminotransferase family protein [Archaeoglobaceae archaeon]MDW8117533.1 alanine--glyoxylate aminotransferase family protein [Archaeoglobaceae archaeon]